MRQEGQVLGAGARLRTWPHAPRTAHLVLSPTMPPSDLVEHWCALLVDRGFTGVRTNALSSSMARCVDAAGFHSAQDLVLLVHDLVSVPPRSPRATRRLRAGERTAAARVDHSAFPATWSLDTEGVTEVCSATPRHRARATAHPDSLVAYAITGRDTRHGYLQRIAVAPHARRSGHARALVLDALAWSRRSHLESVYVNTPVENSAALALYEGVGFRRLPDQLHVMERSLV